MVITCFIGGEGGFGKFEHSFIINAIRRGGRVVEGENCQWQFARRRHTWAVLMCLTRGVAERDHAWT